ncbi:MAG: DUF2267 domain-containing protein [Gemmatimonadetes bacterium]|nr:DUF2267 domain-containing protein [Gemmatimonadota bacterium]
MLKSDVSALNHTLAQTQEWLDDLVESGPFETEQQAYSYLRAVLHSLRDRLTVEEAVHLAAQLPMLVRGFYYEGWRPALAPNEESTPGEFFDSVRESLHDQFTGDEAIGEATRAVFELLVNRVQPGQIRHVRDQLPDALQELWPGDSA